MSDAFLLGTMDGQHGVEDLRVARAGVLLFNHLDERPDSGLMIALSSKRAAARPMAKTPAKAALRFGGYLIVVEIVVSIWIQKAVSKDGWRDTGGLAEQRLQCVSGPGIAAGLHDLRSAEAGIEAAGPAGEIAARGKKIVGHKLNRFVFEIEGGGREPCEYGDDALLRGRALPPGTAKRLEFALGGMEPVVPGSFTVLLLKRAEARPFWQGLGGAIMPESSSTCYLGLNPRPTICSLHFEKIRRMTANGSR